MFRRYSAITLAIVIIAGSAIAAGPPDAGMSTVQDCLVTCPHGDTDFLVVVRDAAGDPCVGVTVEVDFCGVPGPQLCGHATGGDCSDDTNDVTSMTTDVSGEALFHIPAGGSFDTETAEIRAAGVVLASRIARSVDVNNDFVVDIVDGDFFGLPRFDFDCNGVSNLSDSVSFTNHASYAHQCDGPVSTDHQTWGGLKSIWR